VIRDVWNDLIGQESLFILGTSSASYMQICLLYSLYFLCLILLNRDWDWVTCCIAVCWCGGILHCLNCWIWCKSGLLPWWVRIWLGSPRCCSFWLTCRWTQRWCWAWRLRGPWRSTTLGSQLHSKTHPRICCWLSRSGPRPASQTFRCHSPGSSRRSLLLAATKPSSRRARVRSWWAGAKAGHCGSCWDCER